MATRVQSTALLPDFRIGTASIGRISMGEARADPEPIDGRKGKIMTPNCGKLRKKWGVVSMLDKFPGICYNRLWTDCL